MLTKDFAKFVSEKRTPKEVVDHVMEARHRRDQHFLLGRILNEYCKLGQVHNIEPLIVEMENRGLRLKSETYTILLRGLATFAFSPANSKTAENLYKRLQFQFNYPPSIEQANSMIRIYHRLGDVDGIERVYNDMPKRGPDAPTVVTYGIMIKACGRIGGDRAFERAWRVWVEYLNTTNIRREDGEEMDTGMLGAILWACKEATNPDYARRGYRLFESYYGMKLGSTDPGPGYGRQGPRTSSVALEQSASNKGLTIASGLETVKADDPRPEMLELVMTISSQLGEYDRGVRYMQLIRETYPDFEPSTRNLTTYMRLQTAMKDYRGAFATFDEIEKLGQEHTRASWRQGLMLALQSNNWERIIGMYNDMKKKSKESVGWKIVKGTPQDAWTLASTLRGAVWTKHFEEGFDILQESHWKSVIRNPEFPRANLDIAKFACRVYAGLIFGAEDGRSGSKAEEWDADLQEIKDQESNNTGIGRKDKIVKGVNLTLEMKEAIRIRKQLEMALADYNAEGGKGYKERAQGELPFRVGGDS
ncbi:hypothetical protein BGX29_001509 [Mortierella sp. GBA35]|nr:hypothetical protein BGX29_001509 [Mortierella sp. GBA35]